MGSCGTLGTRAWVARVGLLVSLAGCAEVDDRLDEVRPREADPVVDSGAAAIDAGPPPSLPDSSVVDTAEPEAAQDDGCTPNPENELCPQICPETCNELDDDCDGEVDEGAGETDCEVDNAMTICASGICIITGCDDGFRDCDGARGNGCEADLATVEHCGRCRNVCQYDNAVPACVDGGCEPAGCIEPYLDCEGDDGLCETFGETLSDCGGCGQACGAVDRATPTCLDGACAIDECIGNFGDCNGELDDGCELELNINEHCGGCGIGCAYAGSSTTCAVGTCLVESCAAGYADCDGSTITACDALNTDTNCGACGLVCTVDGLDNVTTASCINRVCEATCEALFGDCDAAPDCETPLTDATNCGGCGIPCDPDHAFGSCDDGVCAIGDCHDGWADCDGELDNGCEVSLADRSTCGGCDNVCPDTPQMLGCNQGECRGAICASGTADCDTNENDCEAVLSSNQTCGSCNVVCEFGQGVDGHGTVGCAGSVAQGFACEVSCADGYADCDGDYRNGCEADLTDLATCGGCGNVCSKQRGTPTCENRICEVASCDLDWGDCDGDKLSCETQLNTTTHCGACGEACDLPFAAGQCSGSPGGRTCTIAACVPAEFSNCDDDIDTGCEVDTASDPAHCNGCNNDCSMQPNVQSANCTASACVFNCKTGYDDCDGGAGCETSLLQPATCGSCNNDCTALPEVLTADCLPGGGNPVCSVVSCDSGYGDCNGTVADGCEINTNLSEDDCGACSGEAGHQPCTGLTNVQTSTCSGGSCGIAVCSGVYEDCNRVVADGCEWDPALEGECCDPSKDADNDGSDDCADGCPTDPDKSAPGVCGCFVPDDNDDNDSKLNCEEECDTDPNKIVPGTCGCNVADVDFDDDGFMACQESCDMDFDKQQPGACGCGVADTDSDGDGVEDCNDACPDDAAPGGCPSTTVTIDSSQVDCTLSDFPALVRITGHSELMAARSDGRDVYFSTTPGGSADMDFEIESFDRAAGDLTAWVRVPTVSSAQDTVFYLEAGDGTSNDKSDPGGLWVDYGAVYHMDYGGGPGTERDSTANSNDVIPYYTSSQPRDAAGQIGRALDFSSPGDFLTTYPSPTPGLDMSGSVTMSVWMKLQANGAPYQYETIIAKRYWWESGFGTTSNYEIAIDDYVGLTGRNLIYYDGVVDNLSRNLIPLEGSWAHLTVVVSGGTCTVYENGVQVSSVGGCNLPPNDAPLYVGGYDGTGIDYDQPLYGVLDEVRITGEARSACWVRAEYANQKSGSNFISVSN